MKGKKNYALYYISLSFFIIMIFVMFSTLLYNIYSSRKNEDMQKIKGKIVDIYMKETVDMDVEIAEATYEVDSTVYRTSFSLFVFHNYNIGDSITLFYESENPEKIWNPTEFYWDLAGLSFMILMVSVACVLILKNKQWILDQDGGPWPYG